MLTTSFILKNIADDLVNNLNNNKRILLSGADRTGKTEILNYIEKKLDNKGIPCYKICCTVEYNTSQNHDDLLIYSTLYNNNKVKISKRDDFFSGARKILEYLEAYGKNPGFLILDNFYNLGPLFVQRLVQSFWNIGDLKILISINPTKYNFNPFSRQEFAGFRQTDLNGELLQSIFYEFKDDIFKDSVFTDEQRNLIIKNSNNFDTLYFLINQGVNAFKDNNFAYDRYFRNLLDRKTPEAVRLLESSATIGEIFEKNLLKRPLEIENYNSELDNLVYSGDIYHLTDYDNIYGFQFKRFFEYIKSNVNPSDYRKWASLLGHYLINEAIHYKNNCQMEKYCDNLRKSCIYLFESEEINEACSLAAQLINYYYETSKYDELFLLLEELFKRNIHSVLKLYLVNIQIELFNNFSLYFKSKEYIGIANELQNVCPVSGFNNLYVRIYEAQLNYFFSAEQWSLELLNSVKDDWRIKEYPSLGYQINSLLCSVLYNNLDVEGYNHPKTYYNNALQYGKNIKNTNYYKLLQKAVLFENKNSDKLMEQSCDYFEKSNTKIELARSRNNLGVRFLEKAEYTAAEENFKKSELILNSCFGQNLLSHPLNNLAAVRMLKNDYRTAITILFEALKHSNDEEFTVITINFNLSACFYKLCDTENSWYHYEIAFNRIKQTELGSSHFYDIFINVHNALYHLNNGENQKATEYLDKIDTRHLFYKQLVSLFKKEGKYKQYKLEYLKDVLENIVCPHYLVFE